MATDFKKYTLPNGLRIIFVPRKEAIATTILVMAEVGSKYESKDVNGLSHFLEHMCFKGSKQFPTALAIASEFDAMGANNNAFTSQEYTGYYATVEPKQSLRALRILADMYLNPLFPEAEIEKEKGVIIEEINMYEDLPQRKVHDLFMALVYGDQPVGRPVLGPVEVVRSMTREHFQSYRRDHYVAAKTVIVVAGNFDATAMRRAIAREFAEIGRGRARKMAKVKEAQSAPQVTVKFRDSDQTHLVTGFRAVPANHHDYFVMEVAGAVLAGGMGSRLFQRIREEMGAAYYVRGSQDTYVDHGLFRVSVGADTKRADEVVSVILQECARLTKELVGADELERVKQSLVGSLFLGLETTSSLAGYYAVDEIVAGRLQTPAEVARRIRAVSAKDIQRLAKKIFTPKRLNCAVIGPFKDQSPFVRVLTL